MLSPLARFAPGLQNPLVYFCVYVSLLLQCIHSKNVFPLCLLFPLCSYAFFSFCICKISDVICLLVSFLRFVACFHMCRVKSFVHLFTCWFDFCDCMCICLLASIFAVFLCCVLMFFFVKLIKFTCVVCLQVSLDGTSSFLGTLVRFLFDFFVL